MRKYSPYLRELKRRLSFEARYHPNPEERKRFRDLYNYAKYATEDVVDLIDEAMMLGIRNPDFDGDEMGRPADDFDD